MAATKGCKGASRIREVVFAFWQSRILLTANNLRIFDHLERPVSARKLARILSLDPRATELLLDALVSMGIIRKKEKRFVNTPSASRYLVQGGACYLGDIIRHNDVLWQNWSCLDEVVKTGRPAKRAFEPESFILGMHNLATLKKDRLFKKLNLKRVRKVLDLGGGPGTYAMEFAKKGKEVYLFDRPETLKIARELIKKEGFHERINLIEGDFLADPIGTDYDLILMSQILHSYGKGDILSLIGKARKALKPDGILAIHEFYLNSTHTGPVWGTLFSINMLVNTPEGRTYSTEELKKLLRQRGFRIVSTDRLDETVLIQSRIRR